MAVYALAQLTIHDHDRYQKYVAGFLPTLKPFNGKPLVNDEAPAVLEGEWSHSKVVLLEFPDEASLTGWAQSDAYQAIVQERLSAANGPVLMLHGLG